MAKRKIIAFIVCCLVAIGSYSQSITIPLITNYSTKEYNAHPQNWDITQDSRGIIYLANTDGIVEFDSKNWRKYGVHESNMVFSYDRSDDGQVYMGGNGVFGVFRADSIGELYFDPLSQQLPDSLQEFTNVWNTHCIGNKVYFNTFNDQVSYIFTYENGNLNVIRPKNSFHLSFEVNDEIWVMDKTAGLYRIVNDKPAFVPNTEWLIGKSVFTILPYDGSHKIIATADGGLYLFNHQSYTEETFTPWAPEINSEIVAMGIYGGVQLQDGNYAFNTLAGGVYILSKEGQLLHHISREQGLQSEQVLCLYQDFSGHLWCGLGNGVSKISLNSPLTYLQEGSGFTGSTQAFAMMNDEIYVATTTGTFMFSPSAASSIKRVADINGQCFDLLALDEEVIVATHNVYATNGETAYSIGDFQSRWLEQIDGLAFDAIVAGGRDGLAIFDKSTGNWNWKLHVENLGDEVISISQDVYHKGFQDDSLRFWAGTWTHGVFLLSVSRDLQGYSIIHMDSLQGLPPSGQITVAQLDGRNLFNTAIGLMHYDYKSGTFERNNQLNSDSTRFGYRMEMAPNNHIWVSTGERVFHLIPANGEYLMDTVPFMSLDVGGINALMPVSNGLCWLGADDAIVLYNPNTGTDYTAPYSCILRQVLSNNDSLVFGGLYVNDGIPVMEQMEEHVHIFPYSNNNLTFEFTSSFFEHTDYMLYSYKLEGDEFTPWKSDNKAVYTNLPEGEFTFVVRAMNIYQHVSTEARYTFIILPPWYRTWWAYTLYFVGAVLIIVIAARLYSVKLKKEKQRLEQIVHDRTAELANKNEELEHINEEILTQKALVEEKNRDITDSIRYAEKIQRALLTSDSYLNKVFTDHFVVYQPKDILSGDFYWAYEVKTKEDWKVIFAAVDCTGHGVPGALMSIVGNTFLNEIVIETGELEPGKILNELRNKVVTALGQTGAAGESRDGMDIALCVWDRHADTMSFAGAFNPMWLFRAEKLEQEDIKPLLIVEGTDLNIYEIKPDKQPVGFSPNQKEFKTTTIHLQPNDEIYLFSDGFADQFGGPKGKKFRYNQFRETLLELSAKPMADRKKELVRIFENWRGSLEQVDDVCVLGVKI